MTIEELTAIAQDYFTDEIKTVIATEDGQIFLEKDLSSAQGHGSMTGNKVFKIEAPIKSKKDK